MSNVEGSRNPRFITALTADQVDWSLFPRSRHPREDLEKWFPSQEDFRNEASDCIAHSYGQENSRFPIILISPGLTTFLQENRPPTLFFSPDDISSLLTPKSNITCSHEEIGTLEIWKFTLNPRRDNSTYPNQRPAIILTRKKPSAYNRQEPYLVVGSTAGCNGFDVTFDPKIKTTYDDIHPRGSLEAEMIKLLGLKQHKVNQWLSFRAKEEKMQMQILYEAPIGRPPDSLEQAIKIKDKELKGYKGYFVEISLTFDSSTNVRGLPLKLVPEDPEDSREASDTEASDTGSV